MSRLATGLRCHPDEPRPLRSGQFDQAVAGPVHGTEVLFRENADQGAALVVGPGVVGAGEPLCVSAAGGHDLRTPVAAHVDESAHLAVLVTGDEHRGVHRVHGLVIPGVGQFRRHRQHQRHALEDALHFQAPALRVEIVSGRLLVNGFRLLDGSCSGVRQALPCHFDQLCSTHVYLPFSGAGLFQIDGNCAAFRSAVEGCHPGWGQGSATGT